MPNTLLSRAKDFTEQLKSLQRKATASFWLRFYRLQLRIREFRQRFKNYLIVAVACVMLFASYNLLPALQDHLLERFKTDEDLAALKNLFFGIGTALVGAAAIVSSLVLFAMQVNIERMPYGLFQQISKDRRLLVAFALSFVFALAVASSSIFVVIDNLAHMVLGVFWVIVLILVLFLFAYRRALVLVNPRQQLVILLDQTRHEVRKFSKIANRVSPLLDSESRPKTASESNTVQFDLPRAKFLKVYADWTDSAKRAVLYSFSFARRYAEQGDYEVAEVALHTVVNINVIYVEAKGRTFLASTLFFDNAESSDPFINNSLDQLRQLVLTGTIRRDERQIIHALSAMSHLVPVYLNIDYANPTAQADHALIASGYLAKGTLDVIPHGMVEVLFQGQRLMGQSATEFLKVQRPDEIASLLETVAQIACTGCASIDHRPVTMEGMAQFSNLAYELIRSQRTDIKNAADEIHENVAMVGELFLKVADTPLSNWHTTVLGPYYSSTSQQSIRLRLTILANELSDATAENGIAKMVVVNIVRWADGMHAHQKKLLIAAIEAKSLFAMQMIQWIVGITEILLAVANSPACSEQHVIQLKQHARRLIGTLTWIPDDNDSVALIERYRLTEKLFDASIDATERGFGDIGEKIADDLLSWAFKSGRYETGFGGLENGLLACVVLASNRTDESIQSFKDQVLAKVDNNSSPSQEILLDAANILRERAESIGFNVNRHSQIQQRLADSDHARSGPLLVEIADLLCDDPLVV